MCFKVCLTFQWTTCTKRLTHSIPDLHKVFQIKENIGPSFIMSFVKNVMIAEGWKKWPKLGLSIGSGRQLLSR